ncbi:MAG: single-stranded DNA-binding protein [Planctomycetes bacterium]|nr:single-stranded DNA-binding protein [Planctomycetota bacterium]
MSTFAKLEILGNLGNDPEARYTPNGQFVAEFPVAANYRFRTDDGETRQDTEWVNVVCWGKQGETANNYLRKGHRVYVEGRLKTRSWIGSDGEKRFRVELHVRSLVLLERKSDGKPDEELDAELHELPLE